MSTSVTTYRNSIPPAGSPGGTSTVSNVSRLISDEKLLVSQLRAGEEEAFAAVVTRYQQTLIRMAMRYVADRAAAEDIVQETWMVVMNGLNRFEGRSSLHAWICAILIHKAKDRGVRDKRQVCFSDFECEDESHASPVDASRFRSSREWVGHPAFSLTLWDDRTPEKLLASNQAGVCMQQAIEALPAPLKEALILRDFYGVNTKEACKRLNISETNLYVRLHRARERVRMTVETALG